MRTLAMIAALMCCCGRGAEPSELETTLARVRLEPCRLTIDDRERLDCLYAVDDCRAACLQRGGVKWFSQFPDAGPPNQCGCVD